MNYKIPFLLYFFFLDNIPGLEIKGLSILFIYFFFVIIQNQDVLVSA